MIKEYIEAKYGFKVHTAYIAEVRDMLSILNIVKQATGKIFQIALGGAGDPNKHPRFEDILKSCRAYRIVPNMTTSGFLMTACEAATFSMYIDSQMNCYPCSFGIWDKGAFESMNCKTLREIWLGKKFTAFRNWKKEKCINCNQQLLCQGGCKIRVNIDLC